ncbi:MAG: hypothetical protein FWE55_02765, partial [Synergistaceae bacterium]|nr:hypothetical protein [Synergistaceae bacterium]
MITRSKNTFSRWTFLKWILATLLIFAGLDGASRAGEKFTHDPFVPIDPIMPLSQVKPGMKGECLTVIKGSDIVSFNAEVVDIMSNLGSPKNLIIIKVSGPVVEATGGIASGMSGSPFYINRKLVGAIGYGWNFTDHFHCLVTPIEDMLEIWNNPEIIPSFGLAPVIANTPQSEESDLQESISHRAASEDVTSAGDDDATCARDELPQDVVIEEISPASPDIPISRDIVITRDISLSGDIKASWDLLVSRDRAASRGKPDSLDSVFISGVSNRIASNITEVMGVEAAPFAG